MALALYRKYRPATFAEVVGQEHVTEPLRTALSAKRVNHAYLFSGPRGCGKTSSARILARSLNCEQGPTPDPCGVCDSCISLAPEGPGNVDVVELDAASHGGVDDARELRDRAFYAPASSRYRVFIIDEAHMVTTQGFNALLKIVEEPPEHLIFIFATTEPDKVLTTIRSRTHHYPFRLIPPSAMRELLERNVADEGATVEPMVFPLVIRAGGGSARDTQSVLDQLLAGAGPEGVTYERAVALLGVTDVALIDDMVDGLAAGDASTVYDTVDRLVEAGHDPRRFAADLLDRLRDLVLLRAVPDAGTRGLVNAPADELERMLGQAERLGPGTLTRFAEIVHTGLIDMRGATAPRLLLELLCARMLLPGAVPTDAVADSAVLQRLEQMERRVTAGQGAPTAAPTAAAPAAVPTAAPAEQPVSRPVATPPRPATPQVDRPAPPQVPAPVPAAAAPAVAEVPAPAAEPPAAWPATRSAASVVDDAEPTPGQAAPAAAGAIDAAAVRRLWSDLLAAVRRNSRSTEAMLTNATVQSIEGDTVVIAHTAAPLARRLGEPRNVDAIAKALSEVLGGQWHVKCVHATQNAAATQSVAQKARSEPPTFKRPNQAAAAPAPEPPRAAPAPTPAPVARPVADEPPPPEPPDDDFYEDEVVGNGAAPVAEPRDEEADMVKLLTDRLGARQIDRQPR
ncbi:DNA polymerase III subunit gamma and tau [Actinophytocola oryzae]|uniref:DNA polymerase III subunit gamma and tau n=1 Tax=Actinophytocola oryzae TaxID=502181 RepID=UPI001062AB14|nr:DNA polymerase III subunit gamma and tau [Actinophytocola oryzae]